ncbi:MAG: general stress protein CsbD [Thiobacillus sp. GWE1_62_9]|nr:MAG: general stress protein CsbD [Thiobacillus sp. GWE1_62_9]
MNWNIVEGNWKQFKGEVKAQWGKLTDDHLDVIAGKRSELAGKIQETYGITQDEAEAQIKHFELRDKEQRPADSA